MSTPQAKATSAAPASATSPVYERGERPVVGHLVVHDDRVEGRQLLPRSARRRRPARRRRRPAPPRLRARPRSRRASRAAPSAAPSGSSGRPRARPRRPAPHSLPRAWTCWKPKRPLMQRLPRVTSWSSGLGHLDDRVVLHVQLEVAADAAVGADGRRHRLVVLVPVARRAQLVLGAGTSARPVGQTRDAVAAVDAGRLGQLRHVLGRDARVEAAAGDGDGEGVLRTARRRRRRTCSRGCTSRSRARRARCRPSPGRGRWPPSGRPARRGGRCACGRGRGSGGAGGPKRSGSAS